MKLLELVMIVKNSGEVLRKCLKAIKPFIQSWTIVDTGSTDHTPTIIGEELGMIDGELHFSEFIDFSQARNKAFALSRKDCLFQIVLDDSYIINDGKTLLDILRKQKYDAYSIRICGVSDSGTHRTDSYYSMRIVRSSINAKYVGRVHEVIRLPEVVKDMYIRESSVFIVDFPDRQHLERSNLRYQRDLDLLKEDYLENPSDDRTLLHMAKTFVCLGKPKEAIADYKKLSQISKISEYIYCGLEQVFLLEFLSYEKSENYGNSRLFLTRMMNLYTSFPERIGESGYQMATVLNEQKEDSKVLSIMEKIVNTVKPELLVTTLNNMIYDFYIPYMYIEISIKMGKIEQGVTKLREMLEKFPNDQLLLNIKYALMEPDLSQVKKLEKPVIVIHMGYFPYAWNPQNNTDISGSEYMAMNMASEFKKLGFIVVLFGYFKGENISGEKVNYECVLSTNKVQCFDLSNFQIFATSYYIDYLIISRDCNNLVYYDNIDKVYLWAHDVLPVTNGLPLQINFQKFKGVITLSKWHKDFVQTRTGIDSRFLIQSRNAIYPERFSNIIPKIPLQFIYISSPERGLDNLLPLMIRVHEKYPSSTLKIFCKISLLSSETLKIIKSLPFVFLSNRVNQTQIAQELLQSDIWIAPSEFKETYCISAVEAMAASCLVICTKLAALQNICEDNRGILCKYPYDEDDFFKKICFIIDRPLLKEEYIKKAKSWAIEQTYEKLAQEWLNIFKN